MIKKYYTKLVKAVPKSTYEHSNKLGAGAKKRSKLKNPDDKFEAVMHEFKMGTLHSGSGAIVKDRKQALAIAGKESGKYMVEDEEIEEEETDNEKPMTKAYFPVGQHGNNFIFIKMEKAKTHKYIKRINHPSGKGYLYFYNQKQLKDYKEKGILPEKKSSGLLQGIMNFFGIKDEKKAQEKVKSEYESHRKELTGVSLGSFTEHLNEYLSNKDKWDKRLSGDKKTSQSVSGEKKTVTRDKKTGAVKSVSGKKFNFNVMRVVAGIYGGGKKLEEISSPKQIKEAKNKAKEIAKEMFLNEDREQYQPGDNKKLQSAIEELNNLYGKETRGVMLQAYARELNSLNDKLYREGESFRNNLKKQSDKSHVMKEEGNKKEPIRKELYEIKNKDGSKTSIDVRINEKKNNFTVFVTKRTSPDKEGVYSLRQKDGGKGRNFPLSEYDNFIKDLKDRGGEDKSSKLKKATNLLLSELEKAKKMPIGTISNGRIKIENGDWIELEKAKYTRRTGTPGNYKYYYGPGEGRTKKEEENTDNKPKKKSDKKPDKKTPESIGKKAIFRDTLKKVANILAEALKGQNASQPAGAAIEQTGENIQANSEKKKQQVKKEKK
ncbi:MAG: DUF6496 domain-containing protein [Candidatus Hodarchaeota archaeon]